MQKLVITFELYGENGIANHAAACAYGFLLSMAPMLLLVAFLIFFLFKPSPEVIISLIGHIPFMDVIFDDHWLISNFFTISPGISSVVSVLGIFWAGRILALSIQRGLVIIFPSTKNRNPVMNTLITFIVEIGVLILALIAIIGSRTAMRFYIFLDFLPNFPIHIAASQIGNNIFNIILMGFAAFFIYLSLPVISPRKTSAFFGTLLFIVTSFSVAMALEIILDISRYNFLYGALGNMVVLLVNVYFFFTFFFMGAQLAYVIDSFDVLLFLKLRRIKMNDQKPGSAKRLPHESLYYKLFYPVEGRLSKYLHYYKENEIIISLGDTGDDIYYLVEGEVDILLPSPGNQSPDAFITANTLASGSFFGEMGYLLSEDRIATVRAKTDVTVFALPPVLFDTILKNDANLDMDIIENMSRRLKTTNEQIITMKMGN